jgi:hypothetical protein
MRILIVYNIDSISRVKIAFPENLGLQYFHSRFQSSYLVRLSHWS